ENWRTVSAYDELNRTTSLHQFGGSAVDKRVEYSYDAASQLKTLQRFDANGAAADVTTTMDYDGAGRTKSITHAAGASTIAAYAYVWDDGGRLRGMTSPDGPNAYTYDDRNQLTGADYSNTSGNPADQTFGWDANGNPLRAGVTLGTGNRVLSDEASTYTYDAEGNRTRKTDKATGAYTEYSWDHRNRLVGATEFTATGTVTGSQSYRYDDFGWKVAATRDADGAGGQPAVTESYIHDGEDIAMVFNGSGQLSELMLHGPGMDAMLSEQRGNQLRWSLTDQQNSVRDVVDASGQSLDHIVYDSFGKISSQTQAGQAPRFGYTGRELDAQTGLMDYRARWYDNSLGRFVSRDPIGFAAGDANLYRYVDNRPLDRIDPTGRAAQQPSFASQLLSELGNTHSELSRGMIADADRLMDIISPGRALLGKGPQASAAEQTMRDLTNPVLLAHDVIGGTIGVAKSFGGLVKGVFSLAASVVEGGYSLAKAGVSLGRNIVVGLAEGRLGVMLADAVSAACGDPFRALANAAGDARRMMSDLVGRGWAAAKAAPGNAWDGLSTKAAEWWTGMENKVMSGDEIGAASDAAEVTADVAQIVLPLAAPVAGAFLAKAAPSLFEAASAGFSQFAKVVASPITSAGNWARGTSLVSGLVDAAKASGGVQGFVKSVSSAVAAGKAALGPLGDAIMYIPKRVAEGVLDYAGRAGSLVNRTSQVVRSGVESFMSVGRGTKALGTAVKAGEGLLPLVEAAERGAASVSAAERGAASVEDLVNAGEHPLGTLPDGSAAVIDTGQGRDLDLLLALDPEYQLRLQRDIERSVKGLEFYETPPDKSGSYFSKDRRLLDSKGKPLLDKKTGDQILEDQIYINSKKTPAEKLRTVGHEGGHYADTQPFRDYTSEEAYTKSKLMREGEAELARRELEVRIAARGGPEYIPNGRYERKLEEIFQEFLLTGDRQAAREAIASEFRTQRVSTILKDSKGNIIKSADGQKNLTYPEKAAL
ncbi:MAG: hypothetical protein K2X42_09230, partial [Burkholderiaceae bacterium]|nr:hypothetical protein [Burkholderiaceae bacterium]